MRTDLAQKFGRFMDASPYDTGGHPKDPADFFLELLDRCQTSSVVILIDEYDAPITHTLSEPELN